jgi:hypothetical protein
MESDGSLPHFIAGNFGRHPELDESSPYFTFYSFKDERFCGVTVRVPDYRSRG